MSYKNPKVYRLDSVGTVLTTKGITYPIVNWWWMENGTYRGTKAFYMDGIAKVVWYDADNAAHLRDIEPDGDWFNNLSDIDRHTVAAVRHSISSGPTAYEQTQY